MATDGNLGAVAFFVTSILATFHLISTKEPRGAANDGPARATIEEGDRTPPSPSRIPRRVLPVEEDDGEEEDDDDDDDDGDDDNNDDDDDDDDDDDYDSEDGSDSDDDEEGYDNEEDDEGDNDDSDAAAIAATARSIFADTLAEKFGAQVADIAMTITVMKQILEYAAAQGARSVSFRRHYVSSLNHSNPPQQPLLSGCLRIVLDEIKDGSETHCVGWNDFGFKFNDCLTKMLGNPLLSCSSFLLGEFSSHATDLVKSQLGVSDVTCCSSVGLTTLRMTALKNTIEKIVDVIPKAQKEEKKWKIICNLVLTSKLQLNPNPSNPLNGRRIRTDAEFRVELQNVAARTQVNNDLNLIDFWSHVLAIAEKSAVDMVDSKHWERGGNVAISSEHISTALDGAYTSYMKSQLAILRPLQIETPLISSQLLQLQQSISNEDVSTMLRHFQHMYCWKKILYSLRKDGFNADASATIPLQKYTGLPLTYDGICTKFTVDLWNPLSKADRRAVQWSTYEDELKKYYGFCVPSTVSSGVDIDEEDPLLSS